MKFLFLLLFPITAFSQNFQPIITAFPSLSIANSSRGLAMGDCGVAAATENQQLFYIPAKIAFTQNLHQVSASYMPYLVAVSPDNKLMSLEYITTTGNSSAMGFSLRYLSLGMNETKDDNGATIAIYKSYEYNLGAHLSLLVADRTSLALGLKLLASQPVQFVTNTVNASVPKSILSVSGDISIYQYHDLNQSGRKIEWGLSLSNLGPKIKLTGSEISTFLPTNLGLGIAYSTFDRSTKDRFTVGLDLNKLLVPTPGNPSIDYNRISPIRALFSSFSDAPGGAPEELQEIRINTGMEVGFTDQFYLRAGISYESQQKGNRKYIGLGAGYKLSVHDQSWGLDFHYLVPYGTFTGVSPFQNAYGLTLQLHFGNFD